MQRSARPPAVRGVAALAVVLGIAACTPALNWRETRPEGSGAALLFPCRPEHQSRNVRVGAALLPMQLHACSAAGAIFSLAVLEVPDPAQVTADLAALRAQSLANLRGTPTADAASVPAGATPNEQSGRVRILGQRPDGSRVVADAAFFVKGLRLYQATILGTDDAPGREAVDTFFGAIRLP
jgi:hypothetical protein